MREEQQRQLSFPLSKTWIAAILDLTAIPEKQPILCMSRVCTGGSEWRSGYSPGGCCCLSRAVWASQVVRYCGMQWNLYKIFLSIYSGLFNGCALPATGGKYWNSCQAWLEINVINHQLEIKVLTKNMSLIFIYEECCFGPCSYKCMYIYHANCFRKIHVDSLYILSYVLYADWPPV